MVKKGFYVPKGCRIGCGILLALLIISGISGYLFFKNHLKDFEGAKKLSDELNKIYGTVANFTPTPDSISGKRIEIFLKIRHAMSPFTSSLETRLSSLSKKVGAIDKDKNNIFTDLLFLVRKGLISLPDIGEYIKIRNRALLKNRMGLGEYYYLYITLYFSYLGHSPSDGPPIYPQDESNSNYKPSHNEKPYQLTNFRGKLITANIREIIVPMLKRMVNNKVEGSLNQEFSKEVQLLEKDNLRVPWANGIPETWKRKIAPYREKLKNSYSSILNPLELGEYKEGIRK